MTCNLTRDLQVYPDETLFDDCLVYGPGGDTAWQGRMAHFPVDSSSGVAPTAVGWVEHLRDDRTASEVYIDRSLSDWISPSVGRTLAWIAYNSVGLNTADFAVGTDPSGNPGLMVAMTGQIQGAPRAETWFDAGASNAIKYVRVKTISAIQTPPGTSIFALGLSTDDSTIVTPDLSYSSNPGSIAYTAPTAKRYVWLGFALSGVANCADGNQGTMYGYVWRNISVIGGHGLTLRGSDTAADGFYVADMVANIVQRWAPLLKYSLGSSIENTSFVVPHFSQRSKSNAYNMIAALNAFELMDWGVYSGGEDGYPARTFFLRQPNPDRLTWRARLSDGASITSEGIQAEDVVNGVVVNYQTSDKVSHSVGPAGSSL